MFFGTNLEKSYFFFFSRSDGELRAIAEEFAFDNNKFVQTVVAAWDKLATADRYVGKKSFSN